MPEISRFFGVTIRMYFDEHDPPHFHAIYAGDEVQVGIDLIAVLEAGCQAGRPLWCLNGLHFISKS